MEESKKIEKVKKHFSDNKKVYIAAGVGVVIGSVVTLVFTPCGVQIVDSFKVTILKWHSPTTNNVTQQITLIRRGHPGNQILCHQTGERFASQARAAAATGVNPSSLSQHLSGKHGAIKGLTFENLGEMV